MHTMVLALSVLLLAACSSDKGNDETGEADQAPRAPDGVSKTPSAEEEKAPSAEEEAGAAPADETKSAGDRPPVDLPALSPTEVPGRALVSTPDGTTVREDEYGHGYGMVVLDVPDAFRLYLESGSSCGRGEPGFDAKYPGSQNGLARGAIVEVTRNEGTPHGYVGVAHMARGEHDFFVFSECRDDLGLQCVSYDLDEDDLPLAEAICASLRPRN